jgi:excisionase family DNA binding protein
MPRPLSLVTPASGHSAGTAVAETPATSAIPPQRSDTQSTAFSSRRGGARSATGPRKRWTPPPNAPRRLLTLEEAAAYLALSPWSVRDLQWKGKLPRVALSRKLLFDRADLDRLIETEKERP